MWWIYNKEGEPCFAVESEKEAIKIIKNSEWYTNYKYIGYMGGF